MFWLFQVADPANPSKYKDDPEFSDFYFDGDDAKDPSVQTVIKNNCISLMRSRYVPPFFCKLYPHDCTEENVEVFAGALTGMANCNEEELIFCAWVDSHSDLKPVSKLRFSGKLILNYEGPLYHIPLSKIHSRKNIEPFHASRKITKILLCSRKNQGDHVLRINKKRFHGLIN